MFLHNIKGMKHNLFLPSVGSKKPPIVYFSTRHPWPAEHRKDTRKSCFDVSRVNPRGLVDQDSKTALASPGFCLHSAHSLDKQDSRLTKEQVSHGPV